MIRLVLAVLLSLCAGSALAFGPLAHEIVAEIAARGLTPAARIEVERLLGDRPEQALRAWSGWADRAREGPGNGWANAPLHYVNFPRGVCRYVAQRDCRGGRCVVGAIERYALQLRDGRSDAERATALKWLVHLVADVHQPMHASWRDDRGGNDVQVQFRRRGTNLHQLWDSGLLNERRLRSVSYAERLLAAPREAIDTIWGPGAPARWAEESCAIVRDSAYPVGGRIDAAYVDRNLPLLERRMTTAGLRLAELLNQTLGAR